MLKVKKTKEQISSEKFKALEMRLEDIFAGATERSGSLDFCACLNEIPRLTDAIKYRLLKNLSQGTLDVIFSPYCIVEFETPNRAARLLWKQGVRA